MLLTVAICTWNRSKLLEKTLERLLDLRIPAGTTWELIVVNNNSTDDTDQVLDKFRGRLPLRTYSETAQGQCFARNRVVAEARGEYIIWTDDDVLIHPEWLCEYEAAFKLWPTAAFFGGTVDPWYEVTPPEWVRENVTDMRAVFVLNQHGEGTRMMASHEYPMGANMAIELEVQRRYLYDTSIGHNGQDLVGGDDIDVVDRMRRDGCAGVWVGAARVEHFIPETRMSRDYVKRLAIGSGVLIARQLSASDVVKLFGVPRWCMRKWVESNLAWWWCVVTQRRQWVGAYMGVHRWNSFMSQWRTQSGRVAAANNRGQVAYND